MIFDSNVINSNKDEKLLLKRLGFLKGLINEDPYIYNKISKIKQWGRNENKDNYENLLTNWKKDRISKDNNDNRYNINKIEYEHENSKINSKNNISSINDSNNNILSKQSLKINESNDNI